MSSKNKWTLNVDQIFVIIYIKKNLTISSAHQTYSGDSEKFACMKGFPWLNQIILRILKNIIPIIRQQKAKWLIYLKYMVLMMMDLYMSMV